MASRVRVTFVPAQVSVEVEPGTAVLEAAAEAGLIIPAPCGGRGACGRCAVRVDSGDLEVPGESELAALERGRTDPATHRLACMARIGDGPVTIAVRSLGFSAVAPTPRQGANRRVVAAVDLGTTTVSARVVDPLTSQVLGSATVGNRQASFGADILSRVSAVLEGRGGEVREAAEASLIEAVELACEDGGVAASGVRRLAVAANTAMLSLLTGAEVSGLASHPFGHELSDPVVVRSGPIIEAYPGAEILALSPVAGFVGGDLVAGVLGEGLAEGADGIAYVDIGTNAEIAVFTEGAAHVASAPAGPAFEGWGIECGGPADEGGIVRVEVGHAGEWRAVTGGGPATHLTGSGLLSAIAHLRESGHLGSDGRLTARGPLEPRFFHTSDGVLAIDLLSDHRGRGPHLSQLDVRSFQYAKAAVCVALRTCYAEAGHPPVSEFVVAGSFGGALDPRDLIGCGVLPREAEGRVRHAGSAALSGAVAFALEPALRDVAKRFATSAHHVDLAADGSFTERFVAAMGLEPYSLAG